MEPTTTSLGYWPCSRLASNQDAGQCLAPSDVDASWRPLGRSWTGEGFSHPRGWARIQWREEFLQYDVVFVGGKARNRACQLNERTWELGDVCEVFLQRIGRPEYMEVHITPENQRLQLLFPLGAIERVRAGQERLADYFVSYPEWVESHTRVDTDFWSVRVRIPSLRFQLGQFGPEQILHTAVCRYDCTLGTTPALSSTAAFTQASFHRHGEWTPLVLTVAGPRQP